MTKTIRIVDVTNRDGVQTSRLGLAKLQKTMVNMYLNQMGIYQSEFGFPVTKHEINYLNANLVLESKGVLKPIILSGWLRGIKKDVETAFKNVPHLRHLNISVSTSDQMIQGKFQGRKTHKDVINMMTEALDLAYDKGADTVGVNAEDASRTRDEFLIEFSEAAKKHGATRIRYCDTLGYDSPFTIYTRMKKLAEEVKIPLEVHCHNDLGMAVACSIAGAHGIIDGGQDAYINTCVNGMGERAGNADLVSTILAIKYASGISGKHLLDKNTNLKMAWKIAKYTSYAFGVPIPINQPGVGANAFAHESGIHADGALKDRRNYELYDFEELGRGEPEIIDTGRQITAGEYSGIKGFRNVAGKLEIAFKDEEDAEKILELVRFANVHTQLPLTDDELRFIAKYPDEARQILTVTPYWPND